MKGVLMASRSPHIFKTPHVFRTLHIFACVLFALFVYASENAPVSAATTVKSNSTVIRIWIVGSPHTNELPPAVVPPELRKRAESLGYSIEMEALRASSFAAQFHQAVQNHNEPEILTFDNYGAIIGMKTPNGWIDGIDWDRRTAASLALVHESMTSLQPRGGWVMLVPSAGNYEAARGLAMPPPVCDVTRRAMDLTTVEMAVSATRAYVDCDRPTLATISDQSRLVQQCFLPQSDAKAESVKACSVAGNDKLAFVSLVAGFSAKVRDPRRIYPSRHGRDLGQQSILAVLTNQGGTWRLLAITHDPVNTVLQRPLTTNTIASSLGHGLPSGITTASAQLLTRDGVYPVPQKGERFGDFIWYPSQSTDVIGQVVEFMWGKDNDWGLTRLFFLPPNENKLSTGRLMSGGRTIWRVWSVTRSGDVGFSEPHTFMNCPCPTRCY